MQESMYGLAKSVVKSMGLWYDNLSVVVDTYIAGWLQLGFDEAAILKLASYAFKSSVRTLEGLNSIMGSMFKSGVITIEAIDNYMAEIVKNDTVIKSILEKLGIDVICSLISSSETSSASFSATFRTARRSITSCLTSASSRSVRLF